MIDFLIYNLFNIGFIIGGFFLYVAFEKYLFDCYNCDNPSCYKMWKHNIGDI